MNKKCNNTRVKIESTRVEKANPRVENETTRVETLFNMLALQKPVRGKYLKK